MKILVMEGYYDLATPFAAANWTMDHLDLNPQFARIFPTPPSTPDTWSTSIAANTTK